MTPGDRVAVDRLIYLNTVPFEALDQFYFETVRQMPAPLQPLALDLRVLRKKELDKSITSLRDLYTNDYFFLPWLLDDVFEGPQETISAIGKAYVLLIVASVILDRLVDRQMPDISTITLVQQCLLLKANRLFSQQFGASGPFWDQYYNCLTEFSAALAIESDCMDAHVQPFTYEVMRKVCAGKAAPLRATAFGLGLSSGNMTPIEVIQPALDNLELADQLGDDALDWKQDFQAGRYTLPVVLALEAEGDTLAAASVLSLEELEVRLERHGILVYMLEESVGALKKTMVTLGEAGLAQTKFHTFLEARVVQMQRIGRYYQAIRFVGHMARALAKK